MTITDRVALVPAGTAASGRAQVEEALRRGAGRVYVGTRQVDYADERVTSFTLDVTNPEQVRRAVEQVDELDLLINNAGVAIYDDRPDGRSDRRDCGCGTTARDESQSLRRSS